MLLQAFLYNQTLFVAFVKKLKLNLSIFKNFFFNNFIIYFFKLERALYKRFFFNNMDNKTLKAASVITTLLPSVQLQDRYRNNPILLERLRNSPILQELMSRERIIHNRINNIERDYKDMVGFSDGDSLTIRKIGYNFNNSSSTDFYRNLFTSNERDYSSRFVASITDEYRDFTLYMDNCNLNSHDLKEGIGYYFRNSVDNFYQANNELFVLNHFIQHHFPNANVDLYTLGFGLREVMILFTNN